MLQNIMIHFIIVEKIKACKWIMIKIYIYWRQQPWKCWQADELRL